MIVYAVLDDALSPDFPLGDSLEVFFAGTRRSASSRRCAATTPRRRRS